MREIFHVFAALIGIIRFGYRDGVSIGFICIAQVGVSVSLHSCYDAISDN